MQILSLVVGQNRLGQVSDEPLQRSGHVVLRVLVNRELHRPRVFAELRQDFRDRGVGPGTAINTLGHASCGCQRSHETTSPTLQLTVGVDKVDALFHQHRDVVFGQLLLLQVGPVVVRCQLDDVTPHLKTNLSIIRSRDGTYKLRYCNMYLSAVRRLQNAEKRLTKCPLWMLLYLGLSGCPHAQVEGDVRGVDHDVGTFVVGAGVVVALLVHLQDHAAHFSQVHGLGGLVVDGVEKVSSREHQPGSDPPATDSCRKTNH